MKKVVSLMLVLVLVLGMATIASAATVGRDDYSGDFGSVTGGTSNDTDIVVQGKYDLQSAITFTGFDSDITAFTPASGVTGPAMPLATGIITKHEWDDSKISVKTIVTKGPAAIKEVTVKWAEAKGTYTYGTKTYTNKTLQYAPYLNIEFNDEFASNNTDGITYAVKAYVVVSGRNWPDSGIEVSGNYKNDKQQYPIAADDSDVYVGDGTIVEADAYNKNVEFHVGKNDNDDVSLFSKVFKGRKYWALASTVDGSDTLYEKYTELIGAYSVRTKGFVDADTQVQFKDLDSGMFVYGEVDGNLTYLGKGNEKLPYYTSYYYADKEIELESDEEPIEEEEDFGDDFEVPGETGGDDFYPENVNDNPGTGC